MHTLRIFSLWLLRLLCITAVSGTVYLATISTTLLDRHDVKEWLGASGVYDDGALISALFAVQPEATPQSGIVTTEQDIITTDATKHALAKAFPASFLRQSFSSVIDTSYDWIEGKRDTFSFSVPVQSKRQAFIEELIKEVEPKVATLPLCTLNARTLCRPNMSVADFARQLVTDSLAASDFLQTPLTETAFSSATSGEEVSSLSQLPRLRQAVSWLLWILPVVFVLSLLGAWLLTERGHKLALGTKLSRGIFSSMTLATVFSGTIILIEKFYGLPLEAALPQAGALAPIAARFMVDMILAFAWSLLLYALIPLILSLIAWITFSQLKKRPQTPATDGLFPPQPPTLPPTQV